MKKPILLSLILDKPFLNAFRLGALIQQVPSVDHPIRKKCLISLVHRVFLNFKQWPLVPYVFSSNINSSSIRTRDRPFKILNNSIKACLFLLFSRFTLHIFLSYLYKSLLNRIYLLLILFVEWAPCSGTILHMRSNQCLIQIHHYPRLFIYYRSSYHA